MKLRHLTIVLALSGINSSAQAVDVSCPQLKDITCTGPNCSVNPNPGGRWKDFQMKDTPAWWNSTNVKTTVNYQKVRLISKTNCTPDKGCLVTDCNYEVNGKPYGTPYTKFNIPVDNPYGNSCYHAEDTMFTSDSFTCTK